MAQHELKTIGTTAVRLTPLGSHSGMDITLQNINASGYIYVGANDAVSDSSYGYRILPNHAISFELPSHDALYVIGSAPNLKLAIIQTGLEAGM